VILLYGPADDEPLAEVRAALSRLGAPVFCVGPQELVHASIRLSVGSRVTGTVRVGRKTVELGSIDAVYIRMHDPRELPQVAAAGKNSSAWKHALRVHEAFRSWADVTPARVVNRPSARAWCDSKPFQSRLIRSVGFDYPETLVTTNSEAALRFWKKHRKVIYKSLSGIRSVVSCLSPAHRKRLTDLRWCPTQFQRYVPGTEYRVHVIGRRVFAGEIVSEAVDYRYAENEGLSAGIRIVKLPAEIANRCRLLAAQMNLFAAGIDLRRTPDGRWYCLEVNTSPGFTYFEYEEDHPIATAIARLLMNFTPIHGGARDVVKKSAKPPRKARSRTRLAS
jgi:glutathione synthase/RimK-type ligase-like ATP-grasp enzyme